MSVVINSVSNGTVAEAQAAANEGYSIPHIEQPSLGVPAKKDVGPTIKISSGVKVRNIELSNIDLRETVHLSHLVQSLNYGKYSPALGTRIIMGVPSKSTMEGDKKKT